MPRLTSLSPAPRLVRGLLFGVLCVLLVSAGGGLFSGLERGGFDSLLRARGNRYPSPQIIILMADDVTVTRFRRWPLPRHVYVSVVNRLAAAGVKTIAFDILFRVKSEFRDEDKHNAELARACQKAGGVVQAAVFYGEDSTDIIVSQPAAVLPDRFRVTDRGVVSKGSVWGTSAVPEILKSSAAIGHVNVFPERDGTLRKVPHVIRRGDSIYPSLSLAAAADFLDIPPNQIVAQGQEIRLAGRRIPLDENGEAWINWASGFKLYPTYSFTDLLDGNIPPERLKDRIVIIGTVAAGAYEKIPTPFSPNQPAVELQANALDDILMRRSLHEVPNSVRLAVLFAFPMLIGALGMRRSAATSALWTLGLCATLWGLAVFLIGNYNIYLPVGLPLFAGVLTCALTIGYQQLRDAYELKQAEERYALAVQGANDGLWDWDLQTKEVYFSPRWKSMLGYEESAVGSDSEEWFRRVHTEDIDRVKVEIALHIEGLSEHFENEHRMLHKDGDYRWMLSRGLKVSDIKGKPTRMAGSLTDVTDRKVAEERLLRNAFYDGLTELPNRSLFVDRLGRSLARAKRREDYMFAVLFLDLDRFKNVNDSLGHMMGDELLIAVARRLEGCMRPGDTAARLGGDEFTMLLDDITDVSDATRVAERIQQDLLMPFDLNGHEVFVAASIGIAVSASKGSASAYDLPEDVLRDADTAMYRAKALGKARHEVFDEAMHARALALLRMETDLRRALERENFRVYYQPLVSLETGKIIGFEALVRWEHPERGLVAPGEFIALAEETGLIIAIDRWVLREACQQTKLWQEKFAPLPGQPSPASVRPLEISVNLSSKQFGQPDLVAQIQEIVGESGLQMQHLKLEITESVLMNNAEAAAAMLTQLRELGIRLSIDDFGTGYSSLSYLHSFPLDTLKIDRSFISRLGSAGEDSEIVSTIMTLARNLGMEVIAEGVETAGQLAQLRVLSCDYGQGYYFAKPLTADAAEALLEQSPHW